MATEFTERQRFTQWWVWAIVLLPPVITIVAPSLSSFQSRDLLTMIFINTAVTLLIAALLLGVTLRTKITDSGITFRMTPFHFRDRFIPWSDVAKAYVRTYKPLAEYGGWGLRMWAGNGAYNIRGNVGMQLELKNGKNVLIGTQKGSEIASVLQQIQKKSYL